MTDSDKDDDPADNTPCNWPGCKVTVNPYKDKGSCFWSRYYLWLPGGFYCSDHTTFIKEGFRTGYFNDSPRDMSPEVLELHDALGEFVPLDSGEGQRILRDVEAEALRAGFRLIKLGSS